MSRGYSSGYTSKCDNCGVEKDGFDLEYWRTVHDENGEFVKNDWFCMKCKKKLWGYT